MTSLQKFKRKLLSRKVLKQIKNKLIFLTYLPPYLIVISYSFLLLEFYIYPGFLKTIFFFDSVTFTGIAYLLSLLSIIIFKKKQFSNLFIMVLEYNKLFTPSILIFYFIFYAQEQNNFPNYVFAKYHVHPTHFINIISFSLALLALNLIVNYRPIRILALEKIKKIGFISFSLLILIFLLTINKVMPVLLSTYQDTFIFLSFIYKHPNLTYKEKMHYRLGEIYDFFEFINDYTEPEAKIAIPPQENPWLTEGNVGYVRNLVNPRTVTCYGKKHIFNYSEPIDYIIIASGSWGAHQPEDYGWPKSTISAEKIWYYNWSTREVTESDKTIFDPTLPGENGRWGLIKLNKPL